MMDFEPVKTVDGYRIQIQKKWYILPEHQRHLNSHKLQKLFEKGELRPEPEKPAA
jgi:hypothetical protein